MTNMIVKKIDLEIEKPLAVINSKTLDELEIKHSSRIKVKNESYELMCEVVSSSDLVPPNSVGLNTLGDETFGSNTPKGMIRLLEDAGFIGRDDG